MRLSPFLFSAIAERIAERLGGGKPFRIHAGVFVRGFW
jgi:hypothetical protein